MRKKLLFIFALLAATVARGQNFAIDPSKPADASEVEITAVNMAIIDGDSIHIVSPDEVEPAMARSVSADEVTNFKSEGRATLTTALLYSYNYPSVDADGNRVMLSSLMAVPTRIGSAAAKKPEPAHPNNVVIGCHVTITSNYECPTQYNSKGNFWAVKSDVSMQICYTRYDAIRQPCCLVIMPDYEGYGVTRGHAHPYLYQELTARQVVDATRYGLACYNANVDDNSWSIDKFKSLKDGWKTVCVGYSQGGSVSLATHRFIEENGLDEELHFAGSVCGDGPYDPLEHMRYYMTDDGDAYVVGARTEHRAKTVSMAIVMPLILKGMCDCNPFMRQHKVSDYLSTDFLCTGVIDWINAKTNNEREKQYSTGDITEALRNMQDKGKEGSYRDVDGTLYSKSYTGPEISEYLYKYVDDNVHAKLSWMLTPAGLKYFEGLTQDGPVPTGRGVFEDLHRALASNSLVSGWTPRHRIGFYHSTYDTVVPFANLMSFVRHQKDLWYYKEDWSTRTWHTQIDGIKTTTDKSAAGVYIIDDHTTNDHVKAGRSFYVMGIPSPDYKLMKWVLGDY